MPASGRIAPPPDRLQSWPRGFGSHGLPSAAWPWRSRNTGCRRPAAARKAATHRSQRSVGVERSEEHTSELQSLMRISYAVFCWKNKNILQIVTILTNRNYSNKLKNHSI